MKYFIFLCLISLMLSCDHREDIALTFKEVSGETMGTYYRITWGSKEQYPEKEDFDRWLTEINQALSTYEKTSCISNFNHSVKGISAEEISDPRLAQYFFENIQISKDVYRRSNGFFDPTVMPLVNFWGFGYDHTQRLTVIDTHAIDSLRQFVGFEALDIGGDGEQHINKSDPRVELDFSAVAKGYAIDVLSEFMEDSFSIVNYLVDIGGESKAKGVNSEGKVWRIGISEPIENSPFSSYKFIVQLDDKSIATSGNYRNFYEIEGKKISHTMNPKTGFFERNDLLSASILTDQCGYADGYATACMAMGFESAKKMVENEEMLDAIFIYIDDDNQIKHYITPEIKEFVTLSN